MGFFYVIKMGIAWMLMVASLSEKTRECKKRIKVENNWDGIDISTFVGCTTTLTDSLGLWKRMRNFRAERMSGIQCPKKKLTMWVH